MGIYNDLVFTEGKDLANRLLTTENTDEIADIIDLVSTKPDLVQATMLFLVAQARGKPIEDSGVQVANAAPTIADLILPEGFHIG